VLQKKNGVNSVPLVLDHHWIDVYSFGGDKPTNGILIVIEQTGLREYIEYKKI